MLMDQHVRCDAEIDPFELALRAEDDTSLVLVYIYILSAEIN